MDFNEWKQDAENLCKELKDKAPADLSLLVLSLSTIINMMITMFSGVIKQNETSLEQNRKLNLTIESLQEEIKELKRQLGQNSNNSSKPPSSDGYKKSPKKRSLRVSTGAKAEGQKGHKGAHLSVPRHLMRLNVIFLKNVSAVQISRHVLHQEMYLPVQSHVMWLKLRQ